jgi:Protein of unknown function (DUF2946)
VPAGFFAVLRRCRRPIVMIAAVLIVLQTLLAGGAAATAAADRNLQGLTGGVICHAAAGDGAGGTSSAEAPATPAPDTGQHGNLCCGFCAVAAPAILPPADGAPSCLADARVVSAALAHGDRILPAWRAVRAGSSQAPPGRA